MATQWEMGVSQPLSAFLSTLLNVEVELLLDDASLYVCLKRLLTRKQMKAFIRYAASSRQSLENDDIAKSVKKIRANSAHFIV